ncbi:MAG TPA: response regulator [Magnetospirillum sp.]|jgi:CheY-like chemotaxis protein|nr:response regulator [Magnetospirillum sp.]
MNGRSRVAVAAGSETLALRLRLMIEAEGAEAVAFDPKNPPVDVVLAVCVPGQVAAVQAALPALPLVQVVDGEDWEGLRQRVAGILAPPVAEVEAMSAALARSRVLLVDDSVTYREFLRLELTRLGAVVTACGTADDALVRLGEGGWDCVLIDLVMPGVDGAELCGRAARIRRQSGQGFVLAVLSSREGTNDLIRSLEAGADLFIGKSQDMSLFRVKLGAMLRRRFLIG